MNPQQVIDESLPMLDDILCRIGLHRQGDVLDFKYLLDPFSKWLSQQDVQPNDVSFLVSVVAAFICEYLIKHGSAERHIVGRYIRLQLPMQTGISREVDPYAVALGIVKERGDLNDFLLNLTA
jgi:hypothetical protein